jgi:hypothetical protein
MKESQFLAGNFFDFEISKERNFLFKYFRSPLERQFVRYYLCFGEIEYFTEHTGHFCQKRWLKILKQRFDKIIAFHNQCRENMELELLEKIEKGRYKF